MKKVYKFDLPSQKLAPKNLNSGLRKNQIGKSPYNLLSYFNSIDVIMSASDKVQPVMRLFFNFKMNLVWMCALSSENLDA